MKTPWGLLFVAWMSSGLPTVAAETLPRIVVSDDGSHFVQEDTGERFVVWGVNYDHDHRGELLDEYWDDRWQTVVDDFQEIKSLGANCVRIHLQLGLFMESADQPNRRSLKQLKRLLKLASETRLYLDITGLACYHRQNIPDWYDALPEQKRWDVQANFWRAIAETCAGSPTVFCFDLMNEPILPGKQDASEWLTGELGGKFFVQRLTLAQQGRTRQEIADAWSDKMVRAIREQDVRTMITVGVIPWILAFDGKGEPLFYSPPVARHFDFVAVHFYPRKDEIKQALEALRKYDVGKPLVVEEMFPLRCGSDQLEQFVRQSAEFTDGWISFYWGKTAEQLRAIEQPSLGEAMTAEWLERFRRLGGEVQGGSLEAVEAMEGG